MTRTPTRTSKARTAPRAACLCLIIALAGTVALAKETTATSNAAKAASRQLHVQAAGDTGVQTRLHLRGADVRQQLLVTATLADGARRDFTRQVSYSVAPAGVVAVDKSGLVTPVRDGSATITARSKDGLTASLSVTVEDFKVSRPVNFPNQIVPIFTKLGCNGGGCHGKASGQNGFKLSLLGFEPAEDYEHLVKEARGRRLFPAAPDRSLLLLKATAALPHGGGKRLEPGADDYKLLARWITQGMPYGHSNDPTVARIEVLPKERTLPFDGEQQLVVLAHYSDGAVEDVTRSALFEPNDKEMAKTDERGLVTVFKQPGDVAVMVRYQARVAVFNATVPLGAPVENLPPAKNFIDELVFKKLKAIGLPPSAVCDDSTFLRRVTLDIAGRLPTPEETQRFLADAGAAKRDAWIDRLLDSPDYAEYFANKWSGLLRNKRTDPKHKRGTYAFHAWIRDSFLENKPYDRFVREILTASGDLGENPPVAWYRQVKDTQMQLEDSAQLFLGQRLQCAQCHHHPFEKWSQHDYYSFAAFFSTVSRKPGSQPGEDVIFAKRTVATATNKKTKQPVKPAGLGAPTLNLPPDDDPRQALAEWMTGPNNPFFARSLVNRYWKHFFSRGLVDPEDDLRETNPPTNPELLDALARDFAAHGYDLKHLVRTICRSQVYQLSAVPNPHNAVDRQNFSRYYPKRLTAEVLLDAINTVTKAENKFDGLPTGTRAVCLPDNSFNAASYFLTVFGRPDMASACECERSGDASLAQSLHLLNAKEIQEKLAADTGRAASLAADDKRSDEEKLRDLYLLVYSRPPDADELAAARKHLARFVGKSSDEQGSPPSPRQAYEDILWALINTKEFLFNH
jgi:hypothetical protein